MSDFSALNTALSGLLAHRHAAEVIGQNLANVNTEGYSRQRTDLVAAGRGIIPATYATTNKPGSGVDVNATIRVRDEFMERRSVVETGNGASLGIQQTILGRIELALPEPSDNSMAQKLADFAASFSNVVNQPASSASRAELLEKASTVAEGFNTAARQLTELRNSAVGQLDVTVNQINATATRVGQLNDSIRIATAGGLEPNELMDQRDKLVRELATAGGVQVSQGEHGMVNLSIGGSTLVRGGHVEHLKVVELPVQAPGSGDAPSSVGFSRVQVQWERDSYPAAFTGGQAHGLLQGANDLVPRRLAEINEIAAALGSQVNALHTQGYGSDGVNGRNLFTATPAGPPHVGAAASLAVDAAMVGHPERFGASGQPTPVGNLDVTVAEQLAALSDASTGAGALYKSYTGSVGVEVQSVNRRVEIQSAITQSVDRDRLAVSGVNIDEEMVNLAATQHAYSAAARLMTTIDSMIDTLINRTGMVGR